MQRSPNLRFFSLECIFYDIRLCQLMAFRAYFLDVIFDGCFARPQDVDNRYGDSHWRAANNHGKKAPKLDETGLEIVVWYFSVKRLGCCDLVLKPHVKLMIIVNSLGFDN